MLRRKTVLKMAEGEKQSLSAIIAPVFAPVHVDIRQGRHSEYWLFGGRGSTKSSFIAIEIILGIMRNPGANAIVYRKVAATLRESVFEQLLWAIDMLGVADFFSTRVSPMEIRYRSTGQRIIFRGADDPNKSKSVKLSRGYFGFLWFEELAEFGGIEEVDTIKASVIRGTPKGRRAITFYSYNPPISARNWVNREAQREKPNTLRHKSCYLDVPREWLGEEFIAAAEAKKASNERAYRHMYLGEVTGTGANVFENLNISPITQEEISAFGATYAGMDFGWYPDPAHFARCAYDAAQRRLWIYDEYRTVKTPNRELYTALVDNLKLRSDEEVIADSADIKSINDFKSFGMRCVAATKGPGSVSASIKWLQSLTEIHIDPERCPAAAREFAEYEYEKDRDGQPVAAYPDRDNHAIDAVRYATNRIWLRKGS